MGYVDLHLHLIPGVDDGARDVDAALHHARTLVSLGIDEVAVTPHIGHASWPLDPLDVPRRTVALQDRLDLEGIGLRLHPAGEIHTNVATRLTADELDAISLGPPTARWVLLESPFAGIDETF